MVDRAMSRGRLIRFVQAPTALLAGTLLCAFIVLALMGPGGFGESATRVNTMIASQGPSGEHWFGTDDLGRDILTRTLAATRLSLELSVVALAIAAGVGGLVGGLIALAGPRIRQLGAAFIDTTLSFGDVLLAVVIIAIVGPGVKGAVIATGVAFMSAFARFAYSLVRSVTNLEYVVAARAVGVPPSGIFKRYIFRNAISSFLSIAFTLLGEIIITLASLSFLGLGVQDPKFDWGLMQTEGVRVFYINPWAALAPAAMIVAAGLMAAGFGDAITRMFGERSSDFGPTRQRRRRLRRGLQLPGDGKGAESDGTS